MGGHRGLVTGNGGKREKGSVKFGSTRVGLLDRRGGR